MEQENNYWTKLKEKFPKAHKLALIYTLEHNFDHLTKRWLYDFFDENGIIISVQGFINDHNIQIFDYCIQEFNTINGMSGDWFNNRIACENKVFTKAFEILENKLK